MLLLRKSDEKRIYDEQCIYHSSFYNISDSMGNITYNSASGAIVAGWSENKPIELSSKNRALLVQNGFLVRNDCDEFVNVKRQLKVGEKSSINLFTIVPTTACNARCFYCYEENYCKQTISRSTIDSLIGYIAKEVKNESSFTLDWYGGEPLLCVEIINEIISGISEKGVFNARDWNSSITTNATLFDDELIEHAIKDWRLSIAHITIDGTEQQHNERKNVCFNGDSAYRATWNSVYKLLQKGVCVNLRVHLDHNNKSNYSEILDDIAPFFKFEKFRLFPTFLFPPEQHMSDAYIKDEDKESLFFDVFRAMKEKNIVSNYIEFFPTPKKQGCFATDPHSVVIAPDGSLHACVQEFSSTINWENDQKFINYADVNDVCMRCKFFPICLGGCVHNRFLDRTVRTACARNRFVINPLLELLNEDEDLR